MCVYFGLCFLCNAWGRTRARFRIGCSNLCRYVLFLSVLLLYSGISIRLWRSRKRACGEGRLRAALLACHTWHGGQIGWWILTCLARARVGSKSPLETCTATSGMVLTTSLRYAHSAVPRDFSWQRSLVVGGP